MDTHNRTFKCYVFRMPYGRMKVMESVFAPSLLGPVEKLWGWKRSYAHHSSIPVGLYNVLSVPVGHVQD